MKNHKLDEAAALLGESERTLRQRCNNGEIPGAIREPYGKHRFRWVIPDDVLKALSGGRLDDFDTIVAQWVKSMKTGFHSGKALSQNTIKANERNLERFFDYLGQDKAIKNITAENLRVVMSEITLEIGRRAEGTKAKQVDGKKVRVGVYTFDSTRLRVYDAVCSFAKFLTQTGRLNEATLAEIRNAKPLRKSDPERISISEDQLDRLIRTNLAWRDGREWNETLLADVILNLAAYSGLRREEISTLPLSAIQASTGSIAIIGKGGKTRLTIYPPPVRKSVERYLEQRPKTKSPFLLVKSTGAKVDNRLVNRLLHTLANQTKIRFTTHALRRFFGTNLLLKGVDLKTIQHLYGHSDIKTTMNYLRIDGVMAVEMALKVFEVPKVDTQSTNPGQAAVKTVSLGDFL